MDRIQIINSLISKFGFTTYLEIGVQNGKCFNQINCRMKVGVDPDKGGTFRGTSDEFFAQNRSTFDIIFIDGLHEEGQVMKDIINSRDCLKQNGLIIVHDCNPLTEEAQIVPRIAKIWNGDVWKAWVRIREITGMVMQVVDIDHGVGIIEPFSSPLKAFFLGEDLTYNNFKLNRAKWLNLISVDQFKELYGV